METTQEQWYVWSRLATILSLIFLSSQGTSQDTEQLPKLTIDYLPDELLVEIFDFYRDRQDNEHRYQRWSIKLEWFKLIHVCKRWRSVMFASSSRLDLCIVLIPERGFSKGHMKTVMSRRFAPLPIYINYKMDYYHSVTTKDMGRIRAALKRPDRIRGITLIGSTTDLGQLFRATNCPALESLELRDNRGTLKIPATFLQETELKLRTLKLHDVSLPSISRLLSSASTLAFLSLVINAKLDPLPEMSLLLSHLQGLPCLLCLDLEIKKVNMDNFIDNQVPITEPKDKFRLPKLTSFHYRGHSSYFNNLVAGFESSSPSPWEVDICLYDEIPLPIPQLAQFIDIGEHYHTVKLVLDRKYFLFTILGLSQSPHFKFRTTYFPTSIMQMNSAFFKKLSTIQELVVVANYELKDIALWLRFLLQFPSIKALRLNSQNRFLVACALRALAAALGQDNGPSNLGVCPSLKEIELCTDSYLTAEERATQLAAFEPFISARAQAGVRVNVFWSPSRKVC